MYYALWIVLGIIVILIFLVIIAPVSYDVRRSIIIHRKLPEVFDYIKSIKNQDNWSPWKKKDPNMKQEFEGVDGEVGFISKWEGNKEVGTGEQEIKKIVTNERIESELRFFKPWKSQSDAYIHVEAIDNKSTRVIWGFSGKQKRPLNIFFLFFSMEKSVGKDFEEGLNDLKKILENQ